MRPEYCTRCGGDASWSVVDGRRATYTCGCGHWWVVHARRANNSVALAAVLLFPLTAARLTVRASPSRRAEPLARARRGATMPPSEPPR